MTVPEEEQLLGTAGEGGVEVKHFHLNGRIIDDTDLGTGFRWRVVSHNDNGNSIDVIDSIEADASGIDFDWTVGHGAAACGGTTSFMVCALRLGEDGTVEKEWHSALGSGTVLDGLPCRAEQISGSDDLIASLQALVVRTEQIAAGMSTMLENTAADLDKRSESWAHVGTGTREGEDTDNAKYYAELAQQVSQGAVGWYADENALNTAHPTGQNGNWAILGTTDTVWVWDSDTGKWRDSGNVMKFSDYYTRAQVDAMLEAARTKLLTVTAAADGWVSGSYAVAWDDGTSTTYAYRNRIAVEGVTEDSRLAVSQRTQPTDAVRQVAALEAGAGVVDFYADSAVGEAATFILEVTAG